MPTIKRDLKTTRVLSLLRIFSNFLRVDRETIVLSTVSLEPVKLSSNLRAISNPTLRFGTLEYAQKR